jgi:hypothetical protein
VRLAVRVVDRQIVWAKVNVREHCYSQGDGDDAEGGEQDFRRHHSHAASGFQIGGSWG